MRRAESRSKQTSASVLVVQLVGSLCVYLCRDGTLEGFIGGGFVGDVALGSPVMFSHLRGI